MKIKEIIFTAIVIIFMVIFVAFYNSNRELEAERNFYKSQLGEANDRIRDAQSWVGAPYQDLQKVIQELQVVEEIYQIDKN